MNKFKLLFPILCMALCYNVMPAQITNNEEQFPIDTAIRYGILPNGLTYYIMHNEEPRNRAEFHIAQKVGSILEEENQRGLAHFLEHMAFNGSEHFPGKTMLEYLQNNGMRFGYDINAYTGFDETVYRVSNVPTERETLLDSTLLVLYDWACGISLIDEEINKERGVIQEEWRSRNDATWRMYEAVVPKIFRGSRYANRMPIGTMDIVMNFKPDELRDYYHRWYRPDQQGIIIVGDFDADDMEQKVINLFSKIKMPENAPERKYFPVPDHKGIDYALYTDPEASMTLTYLFFQHPATPREAKNTRAYLRKNIINTLSTSMLYARFNEILHKPDAPFNYAVGQDDQFFIASTKDAYSLIAMAKEGKTLETFKILLTEAQRLKLHGFTQSELERAKADVKTMLENSYAERNNRKSQAIAEEIIRTFTQGGYLPGIEIETHEALKMLPTITADEVSEFIENVISQDNVSLIISGQEKDDIKYPTEEEINETFHSILSQNIPAYVDTEISRALVSDITTPGTIIDETYDDNLEITIWKLSNGATVYLKPTDFKNDEINMSAISIGGIWAYRGKACPEIRLMSDVIDNSTLGGFTRTELNKYMAGRQANIRFNLNSATENISGNCVKKDIETLLQLNYLMFTDVAKDTAAFDALKSRLISQISLYQNNPSYIFRDSVYSTLYNHNPLFRQITEKDVSELNYDKCLSLYGQRVANAGDYTFSFVGNFNTDSIRPLIEKYIASLPDNGTREKITYSISCTDGNISNYYNRSMLSPKTSVFGNFSGNMAYSVYNDMMFNILGDIMTIKYTKSLREEEGGTYGAGVSAYLSQFNNEWVISYQFSTNDAQRDKLIKIANEELADAVNNGVGETEFLQVKEAAIKQYEINLRNNSYWISAFNDKAIGKDSYTGFRNMLHNLSLNEFNKFIKQLDLTQNHITVVMTGVKE